MKSLHLIAVLAFLPALALAQTATDSTSTPPAPPEQGGSGHHHKQMDPNKELAHLTKVLGLSTTQQSSILPILTDREAKMKSLHSDTTLTKEQKHEQMKSLVDASKKQIEAFLNPAQVTTFEQMHQHHQKSAPAA